MTNNQYKKDKLPKQCIQTMNKQNNNQKGKTNQTRSKTHQTPNGNTKNNDANVSHVEGPITNTKMTNYQIGCNEQPENNQRKNKKQD